MSTFFKLYVWILMNMMNIKMKYHINDYYGIKYCLWYYDVSIVLDIENWGLLYMVDSLTIYSGRRHLSSSYHVNLLPFLRLYIRKMNEIRKRKNIFQNAVAGYFIICIFVMIHKYTSNLPLALGTSKLLDRFSHQVKIPHPALQPHPRP